jgi:hypothetical protein
LLIDPGIPIIAGALAGSTLHEAAYSGMQGYNGLLSSCAICFYFVPTWRSALLTVASVSLTAALQLVMDAPLRQVRLASFLIVICIFTHSTRFQSGLPLLTLPFVTSTLLVVGASSDGLPRPTLLSYPEMHRALWLHARREERRDTRHSLSLGLQAPSTLQMASSSTTSVVLESGLSSQSGLQVYRQQTPTEVASTSVVVQQDVVPCTPHYRHTESSASVTFDTEAAAVTPEHPATPYYSRRY